MRRRRLPWTPVRPARAARVDRLQGKRPPQHGGTERTIGSGTERRSRAAGHLTRRDGPLILSAVDLSDSRIAVQLRRVSAMEAVLAHLREAIERGEYAVGDKLPSEAS